MSGVMSLPAWRWAVSFLQEGPGQEMGTTCRDWLKYLWADVVFGFQLQDVSLLESYFAYKDEFT